MTSKPRKPIDPNLINDERMSGRGSVFDRLGAKQTMLHQHHHHQQQQSYQMRPNSTKIQTSSKYDNSSDYNKSRKLDMQHSSHTGNRHYSGNEQYGQDLNQSQQFYNKSNQRPSINNKPQIIKGKINKQDTHYQDQYKRHYNDPGSEILEKKRIELTRELQKIDQRDQQTEIFKHSNKRHSRERYKSPCSSHSKCSSSDSESGSESYTGSSSSSCSSSCSSSSFSEQEQRKNYKTKNISSNSQLRGKSYIVDKARNQQQRQTFTPSPQPHQMINKRKNSNNQLNLSLNKRLRSRSPQSTNSSYYSKKSRVGPLTPPLPSSHHSQSNTPSSLTKQQIDTNVASGVKLDRHGNVRVSLKEKERQRRSQQIQNSSSPSFSSQQNLSINNYSKSSRSPLSCAPLSRSREDLYSSFGSEEKKKFTPSPIHHSNSHFNTNTQQRNKQQQQNLNYSNYSNDRSPSSFYYNNNNKQQNFNNDNYLSPIDSTHNPLQSRAPPIHHSINKSKSYYNNNNFEEQPHPLDPLVDPLAINRPPPSMKRNFIPNKQFMHHNQQQQQSNYNSPLRIKNNAPHAYQEHKKQNFMNMNMNFNQNKQQIMIKKQPQFKPHNIVSQQQQHHQQQQNISKQNQNSTNMPQKKQNSPVAKTAAASTPPINQIVATDEISSISNNSLEDIDETKSLKDQEKQEEAVKKEIEDINKEEKEELINELVATKKEVQKTPLDDKNEQFSDENFSEWSDVEDVDEYKDEKDDDKPTTDKVEQIQNQDNYDDLKFKIEEFGDSLEAISDEEFDAIIDEQYAANEKNGMLSCKQVLDQLDINWKSLIQDKDEENESNKLTRTKQSRSTRDRFKSANLLSQIGILTNYSGLELKNLIEKYCSLQLNKEFDFESSLPVLHTLKFKKNKISGRDELFKLNNLKNSSEFNDVELSKFLSKGSLVNLGSNKVLSLSFNHLAQSLIRKPDEEKNLADCKTNEFDKNNREIETINNEQESANCENKPEEMVTVEN